MKLLYNIDLMDNKRRIKKDILKKLFYLSKSSFKKNEIGSYWKAMQILSPDGIHKYLFTKDILSSIRRKIRRDVNLNFERPAVSLSIRDNGVGFEPRALPEGAFGLAGMRERSRLLGGEFVAQSEKVKGTLIQVKK